MNATSERSVRIVEGDYEVQPEDHVVWGDATRGDVRIRLPAPALAYDARTGIGRSFIVGKCAGGHVVSIPQADAPTGALVSVVDAAIVVISDGKSWWATARA
jgi:hypothetical protein